MSGCNIACRVLATWCVLAIAGRALGQDRPETGGDSPPPPATAAPAQPAGPIVAPAAPPVGDPTAPPSPQEAIDAFNLVQSWVLAASVPEPPDAGVIPSMAGAAVVLRQGGEVVGRGADISDDGLALWRAARAAWTEASARVRVERDALMESSLKQAAAGLTISVELAGAPVPMLEDSYPAMAAELDPGVIGLAVRAGDRVRAMFPATMLSTGTMPDEAFGVVLMDLMDGDQARVRDGTLNLFSPATMRGTEGVAFLKFRVSHLAQWEPQGSPMFLHRGCRVVDVSEITVPMLRAMADGMAQHLVGRAWPGSDGYGMFGRLNPATGKYDPRFADAAEQATAALALRRYAQVRGMDLSTAEAAQSFGLDLLAALAKLEPGEQGPWTDPAASAACVVAYLEGGRPGPDDDIRMAGLFSQCVPTVRAAFEPGKGFAGTVAPGAKGLVAWALVRIAGDSGEAEARSVAAAAVRAAYAETAPEMLVGQMPWLGWAELELDGDGEVPAAVALRDLREQVWEHQVRVADLGPDDLDLAGGIVFTKGRIPLPAWNTARPLAFAATMLGDSRLTQADERSLELVRLVEGLRFLRQLTVDDPGTFMFKGPAKRTLGGVKAAPWDIRMPPDATSLSLLTVCETVRSLSAMQGAGGAR